MSSRCVFASFFRHSFGTLFPLLALTLFAGGCSSTGEVRKEPRLRVVETTLAKGIDDTGTEIVPIEPTTIFSTEDPEVVCYVKLRNLSGKHRLRWAWYDPAGNLYYSTKSYSVAIPRGKYVEDAIAWHEISLRGESAQEYPGSWKVDIYLDEAYLASNFFHIVPARAGPCLSP